MTEHRTNLAVAREGKDFVLMFGTDRLIIPQKIAWAIAEYINADRGDAAEIKPNDASTAALAVTKVYSGGTR